MTLLRDIRDIDNSSFKANQTPTTPMLAPSTGSIVYYTKKMANRVRLASMDALSDPGEYLMSPHDRSLFFFDAREGTNVPIAVGGNLTQTPNSTLSVQQTFSGTNLWTSTRRSRLVTTATTARGAGFRTAYQQWWLGSTPKQGGFYASIEFGQVANVTGHTMFVGLCNSTAALVATASSLLGCIGVGFDTADTNTGNLSLYISPTGGTMTKTNLGINAKRGITDGYRLQIACDPNGSSIVIHLINISTGVVILDNQVYTTNIPSNSTPLAFKAEVYNSTVATIDGIEIGRVFIES